MAGPRLAGMMCCLIKWKRVPLPRFNHMPLARLHAPFDHPDWLFELKYDGFRALAYVTPERCELISRKGNVYKSFSTLCSGISNALACEAVLDGEVVHLNAQGKPQFCRLLYRRSPQYFVAFDLVWLRGRDLRTAPLIERKRALARLLRGRPASGGLRT